jgi:hypothetical protein
MAADGRVGRRVVVDLVAGSREAVEPSFANIERIDLPWYVARATSGFCWMLFDNRFEIMDVRGGLIDPSLCSGRRGESTEHS